MRKSNAEFAKSKIKKQLKKAANAMQGIAIFSLVFSSTFGLATPMNVQAETNPTPTSAPLTQDNIWEGATTVSDTDLSKTTGVVALDLQYQLDENDYITGDAKADLDAQNPGSGGSQDRGYGEVVAERPDPSISHYEFTSDLSYSNTPYNGSGEVSDRNGHTGVSFYVNVAKKDGNQWESFGPHTYDYTIKWYDDDPSSGGTRVSTSELQVEVTENSVCSPQHNISCDTEAPVVDITSHSDGDILSATQDGTVSIMGTVKDENIDHYYLKVVGPESYSVGPGTVNINSSIDQAVNLYNWDLSSLDSGNYTIKLAARDAAGNKEPDGTGITTDPDNPNDSIDFVDITVDNDSPGVPTQIFPTDSAMLSSNDLFIDWEESQDNNTDQSDIKYEYQLYTKNPETNPNASIRYEEDYIGVTRHPESGVASGTPEGAYWWKVQAVDEVGNKSGFTEARKFTVDNTNPSDITNFAITQLSTGQDITNGFIGSDDLEEREVRVEWQGGNDDNFKHFEYETSSPWSATLSQKYRKGYIAQSGVEHEDVYRYRVRSIDQANNTSEWSDWTSVAFDLENPEFDIVPDATDAVTGDEATFDVQNLKGVFSGVDSYEWTVDPEITIVGDDSQEKVTITSNTAGAYTVSLTITDNAGNETTETAEVTLNEPEEESGGDSGSTDSSDSGGTDTSGTNDNDSLQSEDQTAFISGTGTSTVAVSNDEEAPGADEDDGDVLAEEDENTDVETNTNDEENEDNDTNEGLTLNNMLDFWWVFALILLGAGGFFLLSRQGKPNTQ